MRDGLLSSRVVVTVLANRVTRDGIPTFRDGFNLAGGQTWETRVDTGATKRRPRDLK